MKKGSILFAVGIFLIVSAVGIFIASSKQNAKAALDPGAKFTESWEATKYRNVTGRIMTVSIGPAEWTVYGCLRNIASCPDPSDNSFNYKITYKVTDWRDLTLCDMNCDSYWDPSISEGNFTNLYSGVDPVAAPIKTDGYYSAVYSELNAMGRTISWPYKWKISGEVN